MIGINLGMGGSRPKPPVDPVGDFDAPAWVVANAKAYWGMEAASDNEADVTGRGNDLIANPDDTPGSGAPNQKVGGNARSFNGIARYFACPSTADLSIPASGDFIVATWVKPSAGQVISYVAYKGDGASVDYALIHDPDESTFIFTGGGSGTSFGVQTDAPLSDDAWHLVIARFNAAAAVATLRIDNGTALTAEGGAPVDVGGDFYIGAGLDGASPFRFYDGLVDDTVVFKSATPLSSDEFDALCVWLYNGGSGQDISLLFP